MEKKDRVLRQEVFTPMDLCLRMVRDIPQEKLEDPSATFLDPSCGDGNFLVALLQVLTEEYGHDRQEVLPRLYGVEIKEEHLEVAKQRLPGANLVCADALTFDYSQFEK